MLFHGRSPTLQLRARELGEEGEVPDAGRKTAAAFYEPWRSWL
jgi:hypothetical protein